MAHAFPAAFARSGREGYVVEFLPDTAESWIGNFAGGLGTHNGIYLHPNGHDVVVFASGQGYVVDPRGRELKGEIGSATNHLWEVNDPPGFVLDRQELAFIRICSAGTYWHTRRLSWDGFRDLVFTPVRITGLAWTPVDERWHPFAVDVATGRSEGGAYAIGDPEHWERLVGT